jgi:hypothetical protein
MCARGGLPFLCISSFTGQGIRELIGILDRMLSEEAGKEA